jgi:Zn finger protein HypA/HybF involved in hydrogenase expression
VIIKPLPAACAECHTDIHLGQFKQPNQDKTACDRCHTPVNWLELTFDHSRDSRFILEGAHLKVDCTACHKVLQSPDGISYIGYKPLPVECAECHGTGFKGDKK